MKKHSLGCTIISFILIASGMLLFLSKAGTEGRQDYFEGTVIEHTNDEITVRIDSSYEKLIRTLGETVTIEKKDVVQKCDFSKFPPGEEVRVLYSGIDEKRNRPESTFAIYVLSELP